jgi:hypothetical protein
MVYFRGRDREPIAKEMGGERVTITEKRVEKRSNEGTKM